MRKNKWCIKHDMSRTRFYGTFRDIKQRSSNKKCASYKYAGGKGVKCLWESFIDFKNDMYKSYLLHRKTNSTRNTTIGRIDNDGDYCKSNCRWETQSQQSRNKGNLRMIYFNGETLCMRDWELKLGMYINCIYNRINVAGWSIEKALSTPPKKKC